MILVSWMKIMNYSVTKIKEWLVTLKIETPKNFWIDDLIWLRSKAYSFKCNDDEENKKQFIRNKHISNE